MLPTGRHFTHGQSGIPERSQEPLTTTSAATIAASLRCSPAAPPTPRRLAAAPANRRGRSRHPTGQGNDRSRSSRGEYVVVDRPLGARHLVEHLDAVAVGVAQVDAERDAVVEDVLYRLSLGLDLAVELLEVVEISRRQAMWFRPT